jgi:hypothetical protein
MDVESTKQIPSAKRVFTMPSRTSQSNNTPATRTPRKRPVKRRDGAGRIDPQYARELLAKARETRNDDDAPENMHAFLKAARAGEPLAQEMGENFLETVTSGEEREAERRDQITPDEVGGPFVVTTAGEEFATGTDESNIPEALREPLPRTSKADP